MISILEKVQKRVDKRLKKIAKKGRKKRGENEQLLQRLDLPYDH